MRSHPLLPLAAAVLLLSCESAPRPAAAPPAPESPPATAQLGRLAPDIELAWIDREDPAGSLADLRGRVVLLEFWRTW